MESLSAPSPANFSWSIEASRACRPEFDAFGGTDLTLEDVERPRVGDLAVRVEEDRARLAVHLVWLHDSTDAEERQDHRREHPGCPLRRLRPPRTMRATKTNSRKRATEVVAVPLH
jgi:hypothetical protein